MQAGIIKMNPMGPHLYVEDDPTAGVLSDAVTDWFNHQADDGDVGYERLPAHEPIGLVLYETEERAGYMDARVKEFHPSLHDDIEEFLVPRREVGPAAHPHR